MRVKILSIFLMSIFLGCAVLNLKNYSNDEAQSRNKLLNFEMEQSASLLPKMENEIKVSGDELLLRRFASFKMRGEKYADDYSKWAFESYKPNEKRGYYFSNFRQIPNSWFDAQLKNANFDALNSLAKAAITVANTPLRNFPTDEAIFFNPATPGEGYPFDYLQASMLSISYPLFVSHLSQDGAWVFVKDDATWGWVRAEDIKILSENEAAAFEEQSFLSVKIDKTPVYDEDENFIFYARVGAILGYLREDEEAYRGQIYTRAGLKRYKISKSAAGIYPLKFDEENIKTIAQSLLGQPYGWGGLDEMRDCSLFTRDFLSAFGFWLPRNSLAQAKTGEKFDLSTLDAGEKLKFIKERAKPYTTLIHLPGHIMLYVGQRGDEPLVMHDAWGLKTKDGGRAVIGKTAITTLKIGENNANIDEKELLISKIDSINILQIPAFAEQNLQADDEKVARLERAYDVKIKQNLVKFKDGSEIKFDAGVKNNDECSLFEASVKDMVEFDYPALKPLNSPLTDSGRCRNYELLGKIYGSSEQKVKSGLTDVVWLPKSLNLKIKFNERNGAAQALRAVSKELDELVLREPKMLEYLKDIGGTFKWRVIAGTNRLSPHSYAIAIDINVSKSHYWRWSSGYKNLIPYEIVEIFERNKFIWGGRWRHFDTMHFEYRPELFR